MHKWPMSLGIAPVTLQKVDSVVTVARTCDGVERAGVRFRSTWERWVTLRQLPR